MGTQGCRGGGFAQLYYPGTFASGTPVALTGVLDDRLLASFGDEPVKRLPSFALTARDRCYEPWLGVREICATSQIGLLIMLNLYSLRALDYRRYFQVKAYRYHTFVPRILRLSMQRLASNCCFGAS
jgi:hypothetical protein